MASAANEPFEILVGVDASPSSVHALRWACALAAESSGTVKAVMAWSYPTSMLMPIVGGPVIPAESMEASTRELLHEVVTETETAVPVAEQAIVMGSPRSVLVEASEHHDLLVVGRTGRRRMERLLLGSTASHCVRHAECPVVVVRDDDVLDRAITVAVDGSQSSVDALAWALRLDGEHEVLAVYSHDESVLDDLPLDSEVRSRFDNQASVILDAAVRKAAAAAGCDPSGVNAEIRSGDPRSTIVDAAGPHEFLVLGAQGHAGISRFFFGSLADYATQHAPGTIAVWR